MSSEKALSDAVVVALQNGKKIEAIKILRAETGLGLKEAKQAVEAYQRRNPSPVASRGSEGESGLGRFVVIAAVAIAAILAYFQWLQ